MTLIAIIVLIFIPTGFENKLIYQGTERVPAKVVSVDDSMIIDTGLVRSGDQNCDIEFLNGQFKGQRYTAVNMLTGSLEIDKVFQPGNTAYVRISHRDGEILSVSMTDHYRLPWEILLVAIFIAVLIFFAGQTGLRAVLGAVFTKLMNIHGAIMTGSESLLYSGYQDLNLTEIFMAAIFIGSSGAMMDLAVDITSAVDEVIHKKPDIKPWEAVRSGLTVGRAAMGTITTTLLLAYSGSCIAQLMVFMAQGTPLDCILNYKYIAAEIIHTVAGSFGIVAVAPVTAVAAGLLLAGKHRE